MKDLVSMAIGVTFAMGCGLLLLSGCSGDEQEPLGTGQAAVVRAGVWERAPHQARVVTELNVDYPTEQNPQFDEAANSDKTWYAEDGERYEALFVEPDGTTWGRRGPAPDAPLPSAENNYGAFVGTNDDRPGEGRVQGLIQTDSTADRRMRVATSATLTTFGVPPLSWTLLMCHKAHGVIHGEEEATIVHG